MMEWFDWMELVPHAIWAGIGGASVYTWNRLVERWRAFGHGALLSGMDGPTLFVFPPRSLQDNSLLPRMAIEDFLAINNIISACLLAGRSAPDKIRDMNSLSDYEKKHNNLILICSSKSNSVTKDVIEQLR